MKKPELYWSTLSDWALSYNTINIDMNSSSDTDTDHRTSELVPLMREALCK